ncbi:MULTISPECIES: flagellar protein FlaG [Dehalobacter]|uniref:Flagellar biosynthesis protein FlaG n=2 Tax=Dehalobacter restrictus TaxID=55583 RepID=A0A857DIU3_9FIRM|nr:MULTISPECIES: flagellar protein FlaG [Dehalobacter]AHF10628.1 flagellar protein FlaG [Dehalobacter restrictus DSM 9455]MCG1026402.1 flagellar protein FlaG [Dehalobacter sp.]MDJ0306013.1 flagellar protein FlaG [Dehalobacter sp.]QHA01250.1 flagellar biosynthesis protein FlaG [Dehalobacter restrictus]
MVSPIQPVANQLPVIPADTFSGQKLQRGNDELPQFVVDKKDNASSAKEDAPREEVEQAAEKMNRLLGLVNKRMKFEIHEQSNRVMVKIIDEDSGEVLNEIPSKKLLDMLSSLDNFVGLLVDKKV